MLLGVNLTLAVKLKRVLQNDASSSIRYFQTRFIVCAATAVCGTHIGEPCFNVPRRPHVAADTLMGNNVPETQGERTVHVCKAFWESVFYV